MDLSHLRLADADELRVGDELVDWDGDRLFVHAIEAEAIIVYYPKWGPNTDDARCLFKRRYWNGNGSREFFWVKDPIDTLIEEMLP